jgi:hypothetical protein
MFDKGITMLHRIQYPLAAWPVVVFLEIYLCSFKINLYFISLFYCEICILSHKVVHGHLAFSYVETAPIFIPVRSSRIHRSSKEVKASSL